MPRKKSETLTPREAEIMGVLWELGEASAETVRAALSGEPHDSSVRTVLRVLEEKGQVVHTTQGRTYLYRARARRETAQRTALRVLLARLFGGSAERLVLRLLEDEEISPEELRRLAASLEEESSPSILNHLAETEFRMILTTAMALDLIARFSLILTALLLAKWLFHGRAPALAATAENFAAGADRARAGATAPADRCGIPHCAGWVDGRARALEGLLESRVHSAACCIRRHQHATGPPPVEAGHRDPRRPRINGDGRAAQRGDWPVVRDTPEDRLARRWSQGMSPAAYVIDQRGFIRFFESGSHNSSGHDTVSGSLSKKVRELLKAKSP